MDRHRTRVTGFCILAFWLSLAANLAAQTAQPSSTPIYLDASQPIDVRVDDLIAKMTLEEKASQLVNQARAIPRLQVPSYDWWSEALHGVANAGTATVFPEPVGLAATFDVPLIHNLAIVIGIEARAKHYQAVRAGRRDIMEGLDFWSPNINIFRDPRWGRGQETYGEDPFLTGRMGVAFVSGLQGDDPKYYRVISTPKHFAVHSGPEPSRHNMNVQVSKHDMEDTYLPAFRAAVTEGKAGSVMCAYNRVNDQPACANDFLLQNQLRGAWKFNGYVVSDCDAIVDVFHGHQFVKSLAEAAAVSLKAGMDNECADFFTKATDNSDYVKYIDAVHQGLLTEKDLDVSLERLFRARMKLGMFDPPESVPYAQIPESEIDSAPHRELALQAARESIVLLKNDGVLPLKTDIRNIAVVGPLAESVLVLHGNYAGTASRATTALDGIRKQFPSAQVSYEPGTNFLEKEQTIPTSVLSTRDGKPGLKGEYYANTEFRGAPSVVRIDEYVNVQPWHREPTTLTLPPGMEKYSVRWTGLLTPNKSGSYQIGLVGAYNRLWLDGKLVADDMVLHDEKPTLSTVQLEKGHRYSLRLDLGQGGRGTKLVWLPIDTDPTGKAVRAAKQADAVVAVVGITSQLEGEEMKVEVEGFKGGDRTSLDLPRPEEDLLKAVQATGKPLVVVLMNGSALSVNWANEHANAIVDAWYSGEEGGTAIGETLAGVNNPAGRLPVTFYTGVDQLPPFEDYAMKGRTYRYFEGKPLYPFGYGLSYSKFTYSNLTLSATHLNAGDPLSIEADLKNDSERAGDEVVELYLSFPKSPSSPVHALRGIARVHLGAGETQHVHFTLDPRDLSAVNQAGDRMIAAGAYRISVGGGQPGTDAPGAEAAFDISGEQKLPE
jgi:beta-glucosidase